MKILVVGAGIAGSAAAHMLSYGGHDVEVVDAAPAPHSGGYQIMFNHTALRLFEQIRALDVVKQLSAPAVTITVTRRQKTSTTIPTEGYRSARRGDLVGAYSTVRRLAIESDESYPYYNGRVGLWVYVPGRVAGTDHAGILLGERIGAQVFSYPDQDETLVLTSINIGPERRSGQELLPQAAQLVERSGPHYERFADG